MEFRIIPYNVVTLGLAATIAACLFLAANASPMRNGTTWITPRVVGGAPANILEYPDQVSLWFQGDFGCGGSIIGPRHVLSAAHCFSDPGRNRILVQAGSSSLSRWAQYREVENILVHPDFNPKAGPENDIALLVLREPFQYTQSVAPIALPEQGTAVGVGSSLVATGWGSTYAGSGSSDTLLYMVAPVMANAPCRDAWASRQPVTDTMICLDSARADTCQGDSGGALATASRPRVLMGITSFGNGCRTPGQLTSGGMPGVYTAVSAHRAWIRTTAGI